MSKPHLCMAHECCGPYNAIGRVAMNGVNVALEAGWKVTVIANRIDESLLPRVEFVPLYVPPRVFALKWLTARHFFQRAFAGRTFDVVHAHQPQVASLADVFQCHFLTRMAYQRHCLESGMGLNSVVMRLQDPVILRAEDHYYRHWNPRTRMLYNSKLTRQDFCGLYGKPPKEDVLLCAFRPFQGITEEERQAARLALVGPEHRGPVIGFLGGRDIRKGYTRLIEALPDQKDLFLLMGGLYCEGLEIPSLAGRFKALGLVSDTARFYAACDAFAAPSLYEPLGLVAFEAAARGVPVFMTEEVGALPHMLEYGTGVTWRPGEPLSPLVHDMMARRETFQAGARRMAADLCEEKYGERLLSVYEDVLRSKRREERVA